MRKKACPYHCHRAVSIVVATVVGVIIVITNTIVVASILCSIIIHISI